MHITTKFTALVFVVVAAAISQVFAHSTPVKAVGNSGDAQGLNTTDANSTRVESPIDSDCVAARAPSTLDFEVCTSTCSRCRSVGVKDLGCTRLPLSPDESVQCIRINTPVDPAKVRFCMSNSCAGGSGSNPDCSRLFTAPRNGNYYLTPNTKSIFVQA